MGEGRSPLVVAGGVAVVVVLAVVAFVATRDDGLPRSATCDEVAPGEGQGRSGAPAAGEATTDAASDTQRSAFEPAAADAVYCQDLADPYVLAVDRPIGQRLFTFGTGTPNENVPVLVSAGLVRAEQVLDALPTLPPWASDGNVWAPAVSERDGTFVLYYTVTDRASGRQCISVATSSRAEGPYEDASTAPLVCPVDRGGAIDPSPFVDDDGRAFLLWKVDGNCCGTPVSLQVQELDDAGTSLVGPPVELLAPARPWEGGVVEAPTMVLADGVHHLFYSANDWRTPAYAVGHAVCASVTGPCTRSSDGPWLATAGDAVGPGGQEVFADPDGDLHMVFHAWPPDAVGYEAGGYRRLFGVDLSFDGLRPVAG